MVDRRNPGDDHPTLLVAIIGAIMTAVLGLFGLTGVPVQPTPQ
jgi:hypothetical protein